MFNRSWLIPTILGTPHEGSSSRKGDSSSIYLRYLGRSCLNGIAWGIDRQAHAAHTRTENVVIGFLLYILVIGIVAGFLARLLVPGRDPMGVGATIVLGIVGSFVGGFLGWALFGHDLADGALQV